MTTNPDGSITYTVDEWADITTLARDLADRGYASLQARVDGDALPVVDEEGVTVGFRVPADFATTLSYAIATWDSLAAARRYRIASLVVVGASAIGVGWWLYRRSWR